MSQPKLAAAGSNDGVAVGESGRGRRKKVYGYLKAANELRQAYAAQWATQKGTLRNDDREDGAYVSGAFADIEIARSDTEEMVLFPSYSRRLDKAREDRLSQRIGQYSTVDARRRPSDESHLWDGCEAGNAVVDAEIRGWIYSPQRGTLNRKHRLMVAIARRLSGVPAPGAVTGDTTGLISGKEITERAARKGEEEAVDQEVESIINKAQRVTDAEWGNDIAGDGEGPPGRLSRSTTSTLEPSQLSSGELSAANARLMERLQPFLCNPVADMPVTAFFFNDENSQSRTIITDESGHFSHRVRLSFVPTHVRVLASEDLSMAKEISLIEPSGVSLISDIDDTIKHSAINRGAKEIFRNTFARDLWDLTVDGVSEWYSKLAQRGVKFHYVSSSPWQLYPLLERYFKLVGLPPGSFHLKRYSGMLQGIFEPAAERKRSSLERILRDFPARRFILVGDSGEADLEVYTDIALTNPGRILGIFIRDVTTPKSRRFFERSSDNLDIKPLRSRNTARVGDANASIRPVLPARPSWRESDLGNSRNFDDTDLIDLRDDEEGTLSAGKSAGRRIPPAKPAKPSTLRTVSTADPGSSPPGGVMRKPAPPIPRRQEASLGAQRATEQSTQSTKILAPGKDCSALAKEPPPVPPRRRTTTSVLSIDSPSLQSATGNSVRKQQSYPATVISAASNTLQYASDRLNWASQPGALRSTTSSSSLRRSNTGSSFAGEHDSIRRSGSSTPPATLPNKREELWRRRWERANDILASQDVVLGSWRVGGDVQDVCLWLTERGLSQAPENDRMKR